MTLRQILTALLLWRSPTIFYSWGKPSSTSYFTSSAVFHWMPLIFENIKGFHSTVSIENGVGNFSGINRHLRKADYVISFACSESTSRPWFIWESAFHYGRKFGALTILTTDINRRDIEGPLAQLEITKFNKRGLFKVVKEINALYGIFRLSDDELVKRFEDAFPILVEQFPKLLGPDCGFCLDTRGTILPCPACHKRNPPLTT